MSENSRPHKKRSFAFDGEDADDKQPPQKKVRFPKGKKVKPGDLHYVQDAPPPEISFPTAPVDPHLAAKERANRRSELTTELFCEETKDLPRDFTAAEVHYEDNETFEDDGIQIEPFNLNQERKEGYFDDAGNFVEYVDDNAFKDPWLDNVEVDTRYAEKASLLNSASNETHELQSDDIGKMKRRIADILNPDETVLQALRRLKGTSNRKEKMPADRKFMFDQLTEDAMKLLENGDYNVYEEKKEVFEREADGYERLAQARGNGASLHGDNGKASLSIGSDVIAPEVAGILEAIPGPSGAAGVTSNDDDAFDMFAEDDEQTNNNSVAPATASNATGEISNASVSAETSQNDFVYDESSGYYYSSILGYYYDASSGLYYCAASGQWYSYNAETGTYEEVQGDTTSTGTGEVSAAAAAAAEV